MTNHKQDRDAIIDRLLAGAMPRGSAEASAACLDTDTLAAWADDALTATERAAAETHAADCARCQAMLSAMVKSAPAPDAAVPAMSSSFRWRLPSIRWLIPTAAVAAAVLVWMMAPAPTGPAVARPASELAKAAPAQTPADAVVPSTALDRSARRDRQSVAQPDELKADKKNVATPHADALADAPSREARLEKTQSAEAAAPATAAAAPPRAVASARAFASGAPETVIVSSNPASRWRILQGGAVQRSSDGGATWQMQDSGVSDTLSAGASPSPSVCWLVGPGGIVLLSTDGRSWKQLAFPEAVPLVAVRATDDKAASVTTADGREFVTDDGGLTWRRAPG